VFVADGLVAVLAKKAVIRIWKNAQRNSWLQ